MHDDADGQMTTKSDTALLYVSIIGGSNQAERTSRADFQDDDPFFSEVSSFIDAIEGGPDPHILSSFEDAVSCLSLMHEL